MRNDFNRIIVYSTLLLSLLVFGTQNGEAQTRQFYLSLSSANGANAGSACALGYHMASLWEIFDLASLRYNTSLGTTRADSGSGPPSGLVGWVRTGFDNSNVDGRAGVDNCLHYTTTAGHGTGVQLTVLNWSGASQRISPWEASRVSCSNVAKVWCVEN